MSKIEISVPQLPYAVEEALNRLRINIKFCGKNTKKILIMSSVPNEGKTFVAMNLWRMLAEAGFKTVLLDTDLRKSVMKQRYDFNSGEDIKGLDYYLSGQIDYKDVIYHTNIENGDMIPVTNLLENPSTLLEDPRFAELFEALSEEYRYVIVDAPPIASVADGALIASMCDGALLVVNSGEVPRKVIQNSIDQIEQSGCKLLGMVLNKAGGAGGSYGYYGKYKRYGYYGNYYGDYYGGQDSDKKESK
jgi:capsular exopolysaccharide synthesis family protein